MLLTFLHQALNKGKKFTEDVKVTGNPDTDREIELLFDPMEEKSQLGPLVKMPPGTIEISDPKREEKAPLKWLQTGWRRGGTYSDGYFHIGLKRETWKQPEND